MKKQIWVIRVRYADELVTCRTHFSTQEDAVKAANECGYAPNQVIIERTR